MKFFYFSKFRKLRKNILLNVVYFNQQMGICTWFVVWNHLFQCFNIFSITNGIRRKRARKRRKINILYILTRVWVLHTPNTGQNMLFYFDDRKNPKQSFVGQIIQQLRVTVLYHRLENCFLKFMFNKKNIDYFYIQNSILIR